jgi:DNA-directed RNA polymerase beta subunit
MAYVTTLNVHTLRLLLQELMVKILVQVRGLVKQQIDSFNFLIEEDLRNIVMAAGNRMLTCDADPDWYLQYLDVRVGTPTQKVQYADKRLTPHDCRLRDMTYSAPIMVLPPSSCTVPTRDLKSFPDHIFVIMR